VGIFVGCILERTLLGKADIGVRTRDDLMRKLHPLSLLIPLSIYRIFLWLSFSHINS